MFFFVFVFFVFLFGVRSDQGVIMALICLLSDTIVHRETRSFGLTKTLYILSSGSFICLFSGGYPRLYIVAWVWVSMYELGGVAG